MPDLKARPMRRHLYLVLNDWSNGYTIREIDLLPDPLPCYPGRQILTHQNITGGFLGKQSLPPPIIRVEEARRSLTRLVASGQRLMFISMDLSVRKSGRKRQYNFVPIVDPLMRITRFCHMRFPEDFASGTFICIPTDDSNIIYTIDPTSFGMFTPEMNNPMSFEPNQETWLWSKLANPPFEFKHIIAYASWLGAPFFQTKMNGCVSTFTFDRSDGKWDKQDILVPLIGQAHFDPVLDGFVGLSELADSDGHICLVCMDGSSKVSKEKLFIQDNVGARSTLICMGGRSNFCLVEAIVHGQTTGDQHSCYMFRLTPFFLKFDQNGDLRIVSLQVQYYSVPQGVTRSEFMYPYAFWL